VSQAPEAEGQIVNDTDKSPGAGDIAAMSLLTNPKLQRKYIADLMFPGISKQEAFKKVKHAEETGELYFVDDANRRVRVVPEFFSSLVGASRSLAAKAGPAIPVIAGMVGGTLTAPVAGGLPGAVSFVAAGQSVRQALAERVTGVQYGVAEYLLDLGEPVVGTAVLGGGGLAATRILGPREALDIVRTLKK